MNSIASKSVQAATLTILIDQTTKWLAVRQEIILLNPGGSFSLGAHLPVMVTWMSIIVLVGLFFWWPKAQTSDKIFLAFIIGAGFSNIADRLAFGGVRDFLDFSIVN